MTLTIYGMTGSPFVRKALVVAEEAGVDCAFEVVNVFAAPDWYVEQNPLKRMPLAKLNDTYIPDSSAICGAISRLAPDSNLFPKDAEAYGRALWIEEYADSDVAAKIGLGIFRPIIFAPMSGKEPDTETADKTMAEVLPPVFDYFEKQLNGGLHFVGDAFTIADVAVLCQMINLRHAGYSPDAEKWPGLNTFIETHSARPIVRKWIDCDKPVFKASIA
ncbi:MAG: glutathione S-transferase family protein [Alphaproteobacteria bacterium]